MNNDTHPKPPAKQVPDAAKDVAQQADDSVKKVSAVVEDVAEEIYDTTADAAKCTTDKAKDVYQKVKVKTGETLSCSKDYVRRNPLPVVIGAVAFGAAIGCLVMISRRRPTFGERYADEPLIAVREAVLGALAPVTHRMHRGYDSARDGAGKVMDRVHDFSSGRTQNSIADQLGRIGNNLKFW